MGFEVRLVNLFARSFFQFGLETELGPFSGQLRKFQTHKGGVA